MSALIARAHPYSLIHSGRSRRVCALALGLAAFQLFCESAVPATEYADKSARVTYTEKQLAGSVKINVPGGRTVAAPKSAQDAPSSRGGASASVALAPKRGGGSSGLPNASPSGLISQSGSSLEDSAGAAKTNSVLEDSGAGGRNSNVAPPSASPRQPPAQADATPPDKAMLAAAPPDAPNTAVQDKCSHFRPGHYLYAVDKWSQGLKMLNRYVTQYDLTNVAGFVWMSYWGSIEKSKDVFDFSQIDAALALAKKHQKSLLLSFEDRTFHDGCNASKVLPAYVAKSPGQPWDTRYCVAKIWEQTTMDDEIRVLKAIAERYQNEKEFVGFRLGETSIAAADFYCKFQPKQGGQWNVPNPGCDPNFKMHQFAQLKRLYQEFHASYPNLLLAQQVNWLTPAQAEDLATSVAASGAGGYGWPDTAVDDSRFWPWYEVGKRHNQELVLVAAVESMGSDLSMAAHERVYSYLNETVGAQIVVWANWRKEYKDYVREIVIPLLNKQNGYLKNSACPYK